MIPIVLGIGALALVGAAAVEVGMPAVDRWRRLRALGALSRHAHLGVDRLIATFSAGGFTAEIMDLAFLDAQLSEARRAPRYDYPRLATLYAQFIRRTRGGAAAKAIGRRLGG